MSSIAQAPVAHRPPTVTAAVALLALTAALFPPIALALGDFDPGVLAIGGTFAALKLVAAVGLWRCRRWAAVLGFVTTLLDTLLALPGLLEASNGPLVLVSATAVALGVPTLLLLALPTSRRAYS